MIDGNGTCLIEVIWGLHLPPREGFALRLGSLLFWDRYVESDFGDGFDDSTSPQVSNRAKRFSLDMFIDEGGELKGVVRPKGAARKISPILGDLLYSSIRDKIRTHLRQRGCPP